LKITLLFLPTYSPNLNIIERLWKFIKTKALYGKYYEKFDFFQEAIIETIHKINKEEKYKNEVLCASASPRFKDVVYCFIGTAATPR
jgi:transposase